MKILRNNVYYGFACLILDNVQNCSEIIASGLKDVNKLKFNF